MQAPLTHLPYDGGGPIEHSGLIKVSGFLSPPYQRGSVAWHLLRNSQLEINAISCAHKGGEKNIRKTVAESAICLTSRNTTCREESNGTHPHLPFGHPHLPTGGADDRLHWAVSWLQALSCTPLPPPTPTYISLYTCIYRRTHARTHREARAISM